MKPNSNNAHKNNRSSRNDLCDFARKVDKRTDIIYNAPENTGQRVNVFTENKRNFVSESSSWFSRETLQGYTGKVIHAETRKGLI